MDPAALALIANAGAATLLVLSWAAFAVALIRGWLVPGSAYRRESERADKATTQTERTIEALARNTELMEQVRDEFRRLADRRDAR